LMAILEAGDRTEEVRKAIWRKKKSDTSDWRRRRTVIKRVNIFMNADRHRRIRLTRKSQRTEKMREK
jgi:hypothetical protein